MNAIKSGRKDILEEIFGDDLFASITRAHTPAMSKAKPQLSKKVYNSNPAQNQPANRYDDMFSTNNQKPNVAKDPFDFVLDYDQSFLREDTKNNHNMDNQFNTRRSRYNKN